MAVYFLDIIEIVYTQEEQVKSQRCRCHHQGKNQTAIAKGLEELVGVRQVLGFKSAWHPQGHLKGQSTLLVSFVNHVVQMDRMGLDLAQAEHEPIVKIKRLRRVVKLKESLWLKGAKF
jgi:hypothetical protein